MLQMMMEEGIKEEIELKTTQKEWTQIVMKSN